MTTSSRVLCILGIVVLGLLVWQLAGPNGKQEPSPIVIGAVLPLSGPAASIGETIREGLHWRLDGATTTQGTIKLVTQDTQSDVRQAVSAFEQLRSTYHPPIIFTTTSGTSMALKPLAEQSKTILWAGASHPLLTASSTYVLRHSNIADRDAVSMAETITAERGRTIAIVYEQTDYGVAYDAALRANLGETIHASSYSMDQKAKDFRADLSKAFREKPDSLVIATVGPASGLLVKQARELGFNGKIFNAVGFILTPDAQKIAGEYAKGMWYQTYAENTSFQQAYGARFHKAPSLLGFVAYTDAEIILSAINKTQSTDPTILVQYIKGLREFKGTFETIEIDPTGDIVIPTVMKVWGE